MAAFITSEVGVTLMTIHVCSLCTMSHLLKLCHLFYGTFREV